MIAGCSDLIVATEDSSLGMGGPAMIEGGGLGEVDPDDVGPLAMQARNGVVDVVVADEAEATAVAKRLLGYFQGATPPGAAPDQTALREHGPGAGAARLSRSAPIIETLADAGSVTFLRERFAPEMVTALARIEGRPLGVHRQRHAPHGGRDHQRRLRQGGPLPAALRRLRAAGRLAGRHARATWSARTPRRPGWCGTPRGCWSPARRCGCR